MLEKQNDYNVCEGGAEQSEEQGAMGASQEVLERRS